MRERARHRLDGERQIIGDVGARHRQIDLAARADAVGEPQQEGGDALARALAAEHQCMLLRVEQLTLHQRDERLRGAGVPRRRGVDGRAADERQLTIRHRFRRQRVPVSGLQPDDVAGEMKAQDLAPALAGEADGPRHPRNDPIDGAGGLAFAEDFGVAAEARAHPLQHQAGTQSNAVRQLPDRSAARFDADVAHASSSGFETGAPGRTRKFRSNA
ncbi:MAG: hypothetical protein A4S17_11115 [Proteobacteria bacterium HN_bin10]|nr:MAG: hypothetical protein A4S17_11115 [Proteobacteria bacterium HN_bin10]